MRRRITQQNWPWLLAAAVIAIAFLSQVISIEGPTDTRPRGSLADVESLSNRDDINVVFILIDTLRSDRLSAYGYERETSPVLAALAESGVRFSHHLAQSSWTKASMASLWTGLYPSRTGVTRLDHGLPEEALLPAEIFSEAGFRTAGIFRNGWVSPTFGFAQGFDVYDRPVPAPIAADVKRANPTVQAGGSDQDAIRAANAFIRVASRDRWFLYVHLMDVHEYMYSKESALFGSGYSDVYDNSIHYVDSALGSLLFTLSETDQLERTVIIVASDHGEAFRERGLEGHARKVYRETTETPFILAFPFRLEPGVTVEDPSRNVDIWPTVLDLLGLPPIGDTDGISRRSEILASLDAEEASAEPNDEGYAHLDQTWGNNGAESFPTVAVVEEPYRFVMSAEFDGNVREELFRRDSDPAELEDIASKEPETAKRLREKANAYLDWKPAWESEVPSLEIDELELNHLRALGYALP